MMFGAVEELIFLIIAILASCSRRHLLLLIVFIILPLLRLLRHLETRPELILGPLQLLLQIFGPLIYPFQLALDLSVIELKLVLILQLPLLINQSLKLSADALYLGDQTVLLLGQFITHLDRLDI